MEPSEQLQAYIVASLAKNVSETAIANTLRDSGWSDEAIRAGLQHPSAVQAKQAAAAASKAKYPHKVRNGILWIFSPGLLLVGVAGLQLIIHGAGLHLVIVNIISILAGVAAIILIPGGLIMGILTLSRK